MLVWRAGGEAAKQDGAASASSDEEDEVRVCSMYGYICLNVHKTIHVHFVLYLKEGYASNSSGTLFLCCLNVRFGCAFYDVISCAKRSGPSVLLICGDGGGDLGAASRASVP